MPSSVTGVIQDLERILLTPAQISARVDAMAARLNAELAGKVVTVVALMDGGLFDDDDQSLTTSDVDGEGSDTQDSLDESASAPGA